ncbi:hypothetical protein LCGC14_3050320 [marine sediment metagenome]|uniref:Uncharacterized protein n=1 Tax=marine sediment metagenome TaxID=412755 RepID=A0A0F8YUZ1_9ZZZZ
MNKEITKEEEEMFFKSILYRRAMLRATALVLFIKAKRKEGMSEEDIKKIVESLKVLL